MSTKKPDFQQAFNRLEEITAVMEDHESSLEKAMALYKEGIELTQFLWQKLQRAEQDVALLQKTSEGLFKLEAFEKDESGAAYESF